MDPEASPGEYLFLFPTFQILHYSILHTDFYLSIF